MRQVFELLGEIMVRERVKRCYNRLLQVKEHVRLYLRLKSRRLNSRTGGEAKEATFNLKYTKPVSF